MNKIIRCWIIQKLGLLKRKERLGTKACQESGYERTTCDSRVYKGLACTCKPEIGAVPCRPRFVKNSPEELSTSTILRCTTNFWRYLNNRENDLKGVLNIQTRFNLVPVNLSYEGQGQRLRSTLIRKEGS